MYLCMCICLLDNLALAEKRSAPHLPFRYVQNKLGRTFVNAAGDIRTKIRLTRRVPLFFTPAYNAV